ncbi:MAG: phosphoethanolamine transferase [Paludibacteraceae bacterium]|nr:phosphoethanolamine transferase [Paludibacteraceae bacterium]
MILEGKRKEIGAVAVLLLLLLLPNLVVACMAEELDGFVVKKMGYLAVSLASLFVPALVFKRKVYFLLEGVFCLLLAPIELASMFLNHSTTHFMMMDTLFSTNWHEAVELASSVWHFVLLFLLVLVAYFFLTIRYVRNEAFFPAKVRKWFLVLLSVLFVVGFSYFLILARTLLTSEETTLKDNLVDAKDLMVEKFRKIFPFDVYIATSEVFEHRALVREMQASLSNFSFGLQPKSDEDEEVVVLVIGETARWKNFGINGYARPTTPNLSRQKNLVPFSHLITQANLTSHSVPLILTRADALHRGQADAEKSICEAFSEAGFYTAWLSSQVLTPYQERIINTCDSSVVLDKMISKNSSYDLNLVPSFECLLSQPAPKKFILIHSMGSHFKYNERYPSDSACFQPSFDNTMDFLSASSENAEYLVNAYDNSIRYTDAFLSALIRKMEAKGGVWSMIYLSDHGENLYDDDRKLILHGTLVVSEYEAHIPFLVAYSDEYQNSYPEKVQNLTANKDKNQTSAVVFHSLLDMAGLQSDVVVDSLSIVSLDLRDLDSSYVLNGDMKPIPFDFSQLENAQRRE